MRFLLPAVLLGLFSGAPGLAAESTPAYAGKPYQDALYAGGPQRIPGAVFCAYYDRGGEGIAYHDLDAENQGSGKLNPADGSYLNEFRRHEGIDISYTKPLPDRESPGNRVTPPLGLLYVGWNRPGEWFKLTVDIAEAGTYVADVLYTSHEGGEIGVEIAGTAAAIRFNLESTFDPAETIPWRQWHHWNVARDAFTLTLPKGTTVLTVHILTHGELNLATFHFRPAGAPRPATDVTTLSTALPRP